jgi:aryl carrier-like protein
MPIADGLTAAVRFEEMHEGTLVGEAAETVRENLIEYCGLDTLAMLKIVERLRELVEPRH